MERRDEKTLRSGGIGDIYYLYGRKIHFHFHEISCRGIGEYSTPNISCLSSNFDRVYMVELGKHPAPRTPTYVNPPMGGEEASYEQPFI